MKKKNIIIAVLVVCSLLIAGSGGYLVFKAINDKQSDDSYRNLASSYVHMTDPSGMSQENAYTADATSGTGVTYAASSAAPSTVPATTVVPYLPAEQNPVDFQEIQDVENDEIYSWIKVPNTAIDYPVLQSKTSDFFYLDHGVNKQYSFAGAIYSQFCNKTDYSDRVTVLYGHNMNNGSMFATLLNFSDPDFFASNKDIYIYTDNMGYSYEIVSAYYADTSHIMNSHDFSNDDVYKSFLEDVLHPHSISGNVRDGATLDINDRLLILSTCSNSGAERFLVVGKLVAQQPLENAG